MENKDRMEHINDNPARINRIIRKLETVRQKEKAPYLLNLPLSVPEVEEFERKQGVRLPEDYRDFLLYVGNGGVGPFWGIHELKDWNDYYISFETNEVPAGFLTSPSPLRPFSCKEDVDRITVTGG